MNHRALVGLIYIVLVTVACTEPSHGSAGGETHFVVCTTNFDCGSGEACVDGECVVQSGTAPVPEAAASSPDAGARTPLDAAFDPLQSNDGGANASNPAEPPPSGNASAWLADPTPGVYDMKLDATYVYWVTDGTFGPAGVWRASRASGVVDLVTAAQERAYSLAIDEQYVYFTHAPNGADTGGMIFRVEKSGGMPQPLLNPGDWYPTSVAVDDSSVYFNKAYSLYGSVWQVSKQGGAPQPVSDGLEGPWDIAVEGGALFVSEMNRGRILRESSRATDADVVLASGFLATERLHVAGGFAYFSACYVGSCGTHYFYEVPVTGDAPRELHEAPHDSGYGRITSGTGFLLWGSWFVPLDGSKPTELAPTLDGMEYVAVATDDRDAYIADYPSGQIFHIALGAR